MNSPQLLKLVVLVSLAGLALRNTASAQPTAAPPQRTPRSTPPLVIAHRGASGYLPEHTLAAKSLAYGMGADYLEQDVVLTRDGVAIVLHDIHVDTVTDVADVYPNRAREDGRFYAIDFDLAEIKRLHVRERVDWKQNQPIFPQRFPAGPTGLTIPTLQEEIDLIKGLNRSTGGRVGIYTEIKQPAWHRRSGQDIARITLGVLRRAGYDRADSPAFLQCFDPACCRRLRKELKAQIKLIQLIGDDREKGGASLVTEKGLRAVAAYADGIGPAMTLVVDPQSGQPTPLIERAHLAGLLVHPYTFRADALPDYAESFEDLVRRFSHAGIDGLFTDFPDRARRAIESPNHRAE